MKHQKRGNNGRFVKKEFNHGLTTNKCKDTYQPIIPPKTFWQRWAEEPLLKGIKSIAGRLN